ncbi:MAG: S8 family serine peptidase [Euryarchaeota archaeon]|nr:S8 family serine peptidase [Euryarchaeota archaeon]MBT5254589.1 S8 family serine peptidase [Euryarchaeota archaeon]
MMSSRKAILMLILLLMTSISPALADSSTTRVKSSSTYAETSVLAPTQQDYLSTLDEQQKLELAAEHWNQMNNPEIFESSIKTSTGILNLAIGSFDPTSEQLPILDSNLLRHNDNLMTGMAIIQLFSHDGLILESLVEDYELTILDFISDEGWLIRLPHTGVSLNDLQQDSRIRWAGVEHPAMRISPQILDNPQTSTKLAIIPASDLASGGLSALSKDIVSYGAESAWCGIGLCEVNIAPNNIAPVVKNIAFDGRVIWQEPSYDLELHNAVAGAVSGVLGVTNNATFTLDGSGEMIAITDTGLDRDHPDINGRVIGVYTQFGLDPSPADTNTGHGTHVALTVAGDGVSDSSAKGIAPNANIVVYALEHDATGVFGRQGSIYDMLKDAEQMTARIAVNAWGLNGNYGQYTADSRSTDIFVVDKPAMLPVFSVGDGGSNGASQVTAPATAKNVLAVGVSTTGTGSSAAVGSVDAISSLGPSLDGRIKPDVVAPGMELCSGRAEEAKYPAGNSCASGTHGNGDPLYMSLSGTSQATAVAGGVSALTRQFIREEVGLSAPDGALVKAAVINGATDLGVADIPNFAEGWGQVNLERTVLPMDGSTVLDTYFDQNNEINPGYGLLYAFDLDPSNGIDITLAWTDNAGSANAPQSESRLVNDLDLVLVDPSGNEWLGNVFNNGYSQSGGQSDDVNNVERIKIAAGSASNSGQWLVKVMHRGGNAQSFGLVMSAKATPVPLADYTTFDGSIATSSTNPLKNDLVTLRISWNNQGTLTAGSMHLILEDLTTQDILYESDTSTLDPGQLNSISIYHSFAETGTHQLKLSLDTNDQVTEMNDANSGVDNNIWIEEIEVMALGVRVVAHNLDGTIPTTAEDRENSALLDFDVANETGIDIPLTILHEGTGNQSVSIYVTNVQMPDPQRPELLLPPSDTWSKSLSESGPYPLTAQGTAGDSTSVTLHLEDESANLDDMDEPRYARYGVFVVDVTVSYQLQPTVAHTQRLTITIDKIDDVHVVAAGTNGLTAEPGESTAFSISVMNTGNAPSQYQVDCVSENRWQLMLGGSNSSSLQFEPLDIREYLPMPIRIFVPPVAQGTPLAGSTDTVTCWVTSLTDASMNHTEIVTIEVLPQRNFKTDLNDDFGPLGPSATAKNIAVDGGQQIHLNLSVENTGNLEIDLEVAIQPADPNWPIQVTLDEQSDSREVSLTLSPGQTKVVHFVLGVPLVAVEGDSNTFTIRTERTAQDFKSNTTTLVVGDELGIELRAPQSGVVETSISSEFSFGEFEVENIGNTGLELQWSHGLTPDGWTAGFANPTLWLEPRDVKTIRLGFIPPANSQVTNSAFDLLVSVSASNAGRIVEDSVRIDVAVIQSVFANISVEDDSKRPFIGVTREETISQNIIIRNDGNVPISGDLSIDLLDNEGIVRDDWTASFSPQSIDNLGIGESLTVVVSVTPGELATSKRAMVTLNMTVQGDVVGQLVIESSVQAGTGNGGLLNVLPLWVSLPLIGILLAVAVIYARRMKRSGELSDSGEELVAPDAHANPDHLGTRRDEAFDIGGAVHELTSGEVSSDEIAAALAQSIIIPKEKKETPLGLPPSAMKAMGQIPKGLPPAGLPPVGLPPVNLPKQLPALPIEPLPVAAPVITPSGPPVPEEGLPSGWTMEQWTHYGHQWLERNGRA